jgi:hypothetical protein
MTPEALRKEWIKLNRLKRTDIPDEEGLKEINSAYDTLKHGSRGFSGTGQPYQPAAPQKETPKWAMAGYSGGIKPSAQIRRNDYSDANFIKKRMWELSGESNVEWTIWAFDGRFFRASTTVYGSPEIFHDMAEAMIMWNSHSGNPYETNASGVIVSAAPTPWKAKT